MSREDKIRDPQKQIERAQIVVDQVADMLAQKWTKTQIFNSLRKTFPDLKRRTVRALIRKATKDIMERYGIDPEEYKGAQIAFYEYVLRGTSFDNDGCRATVKERLVAAERLDKLFNLENITNADPAEKAAKIIEFIKQAKATVGSGVDPNKKAEEDDTEQLNKPDGIPKENGTAEPSAADNQECAKAEAQTGDSGDSGDDLDEDEDILGEFGTKVV
ncbi:MAG: hypothetical protein JRD89_17665 [Deltaproteobacteria bacterium]|nr:hypothetical protein [Deltaproteobacteria bacterium]